MINQRLETFSKSRYQYIKIDYADVFHFGISSIHLMTPCCSFVPSPMLLSLVLCFSYSNIITYAIHIIHLSVISFNIAVNMAGNVIQLEILVRVQIT